MAVSVKFDLGLAISMGDNNGWYGTDRPTYDLRFSINPTAREVRWRDQRPKVRQALVFRVKKTVDIVQPGLIRVMAPVVKAEFNNLIKK